MSGIKPVELTEFYRTLHARGMTVGGLAATVFSGRAHVTQVLNGRRPGSQTWRKLERVLTQEELALLGRVPRGALSHVGQMAEAEATR